jgi:hypothetical protein
MHPRRAIGSISTLRLDRRSRGQDSCGRSAALGGRAVLTVVAAWMARAAIRRYRSPAVTPRAVLQLRTPLRTYTALAGITMLNPLTLVYRAALMLGHQASAAAFTTAQAGVFVLAVVAASAS